MSFSEDQRLKPASPDFLPFEFLDRDTLIGDDIKQAREHTHKSQKEIAALSGITAVQLCRIENNESIPTQASLKALSPHIGISYTDLLIKAGYNSTVTQPIYYDKNGQEIDIYSIIAGIYYADPELLSDLQDILTYATTDNIIILRLLIKAFKKERDSHDNNTLKDSFFTSLKNFLKESITLFSTE